MTTKPEEVTLTIVGDGGVGKSCLTQVYVFNEFTQNHIGTIEDYFQTQIKLDGKDILVKIVDTAGQDEFQSLRSDWIRQGNGFILVYDITDDSQKSLYTLKEWLKAIERVKCQVDGEEGAGEGYPFYPLVMVGNKLDLEKSRNIDFDEAQSFFKQNVKLMAGTPQKDTLPMLFESSAKTGHNVTNVFESCIRQVLLKRERDKKKSRKSWRKLSSPPPLDKKMTVVEPKQKTSFFSFLSSINSEDTVDIIRSPKKEKAK